MHSTRSPGTRPPHIAFDETEEDLHDHDTPRADKLKVGDTRYAQEQPVSPTGDTVPDGLGDMGSPHVGFATPEDLLQEHDVKRAESFKKADEAFVDGPSSPHVGFADPETVLQDHEQRRLATYKKGDEHVPTEPLTVEVAPFRILFLTPEDLLTAHEMPRSSALKVADEPFVKVSELPRSPTEDDSGRPTVFEETKNLRYGNLGKSYIPHFWHTNMVAAGLRTVAVAAHTITEEQRAERVALAENLYKTVSGDADSVSLSDLQRSLPVDNLKAIQQAVTTLIRDIGAALDQTNTKGLLAKEDFVALILTMGCLSTQQDFAAFVGKVQASMVSA